MALRRPAPGRGPRHREGDGRPAARRARSATRRDLVRTATTIEQVHTERRMTVPALGRRGHLRGLHPLQRAAARGPGELVPLFDGLTRWIASTLIALADLPFTFLPPRGGRRLTRLGFDHCPPPASPRRAILALAVGAPAPGRLRRSAAPAAPPPGQGLVLDRPTPQQCRWSTSTAAACRWPGCAARSSSWPPSCPCARTSARSSPAPSSPRSATCRRPDWPTRSSSSRRRSTPAATPWPAWPPTRRNSGPTGTYGPAPRPTSRPSGSPSA